MHNFDGGVLGVKARPPPVRQQTKMFVQILYLEIQYLMGIL